MKLEDCVPDRERCEQLMAAGMPQETLFKWVWQESEDRWFVCSEEDRRAWSQNQLYFAAPLVSELLERLPKRIRYKEHDCRLLIRFQEVGNLVVGYRASYDMWAIGMSIRDTLPNALADLLLWAKKEGYAKW